MKTRLYHTIIVCGSALGAATLGCGEAIHDPSTTPADAGTDSSLDAATDAGIADSAAEARCALPNGDCNEHCTPLADGGCLDPCFVHTKTCSPDCLALDGTCGWPPTK